MGGFAAPVAKDKRFVLGGTEALVGLGHLVHVYVLYLLLQVIPRSGSGQNHRRTSSLVPHHGSMF